MASAISSLLSALLAVSAMAGSPSPAVQPTAAGWVDEIRMAHAAQEPDQWLTTGRDFSAAYYSPLTQIDKDNVHGLGFAWEYRLGTRRGLEATPLVVDGVMYASGNWGVVYALDAVTGKLRWTFDPKGDYQAARYQQQDIVNRGVAVWKGRVYVVSGDCRLIALDASSGKALWDVNTLVDRSQPYACAGYPQIAGKVIVVGNVGADTNPGGLRGYVSAYDASSGAFRWRFYTVPSLSEKTPEPSLKVAAKTWDPKRDPKWGGGGTVWNGMAYDPKLDLVYLGTANAAPWAAPRDASGHGTDNLYTASILALKANTGKLSWYYQATPGDRWDYDATATMVLADLTIGGQRRETLLQANKNGYFYVLDRATGKPISIKGFSYMNWSTGIGKNYRPIVAPDSEYNTRPRVIYPWAAGAHMWPPMAFSPKTGLAYIPVIDAPNILVDLTRNPGASIKFIDESTDGIAAVPLDKSYDPAAWTPLVGQLPKVPAVNPNNGRPTVRASIRAWDPVSQKVVWEQETSRDLLVIEGGTLATAGDVVFAGREDGAFVAYDARSGATLKVLATGTPIMAAPMSYQVNGTQYVAVMAAHGGGFMGSFVGTAAMKYVNEGRILVFKLGGSAEVPKPPVRVQEPWREPPSAHASPEQVASGMRLFNVWCARCHALGVPGVTPDLSRLQDGIDKIAVFQAIVLQGAFVSGGMARFDDVLSAADTEAIHAYLIDQARQNYVQQQRSRTHSE